jgi:hypothetical protein
MTKPTVKISYGHGFCDDGNATTNWSTKVLTNMTDGQTSIAATNDDYFTVKGVCDSADDESVYFENDITNLAPTIYTKFLVRWKTSVASNGCGARVQLVFADNSTQDLLQAAAIPQFSTTWTVTTGTITTGSNINKVRIWADDYPDDCPNGTYYVYVDCILLFKDWFTFPNTEFGTEFTPPPRYAMIPIPSRIVDITQNLGCESAIFTASCNLDIGKLLTTASAVVESDWKRPQGTDTKDIDENMNGQVFVDIAHNSITEPFQWLDTGKQQFKVTLDTLRFPERSDSHTVDLTFKEYSRSSKSNETYVERFGLNL